MKGFAFHEMFTTFDKLAYAEAYKIVAMWPEDGTSCHELAKVVAEKLGVPVIRGSFGMVEHSWLQLPSGAILDVYAPGRYPPVQLVDGTTVTLPTCYVPCD